MHRFGTFVLGAQQQRLVSVFFILTYALLYPAPQPKKIKAPVASVPFHEKPP